MSTDKVCCCCHVIKTKLLLLCGCLFVCLFLSLFARLFVCFLFCLFPCTFVWLHAYLSVCLFLCLSFCPFIDYFFLFLLSVGFCVQWAETKQIPRKQNTCQNTVFLSQYYKNFFRRKKYILQMTY